jgi:hypothetical protein
MSVAAFARLESLDAGTPEDVDGAHDPGIERRVKLVRCLTLHEAPRRR